MARCSASTPSSISILTLVFTRGRDARGKLFTHLATPSARARRASGLSSGMTSARRTLLPAAHA